jgi:hypothetical protein
MDKKEKKHLVALEIIGLMVTAVIGVFAVHALGLYEAADSSVVKLGMGAGAAYFFAMCFWAALHR